jgi:hypothetical protein
MEVVVENDPLSASIQVSKTGMLGSCVFLVNPPPNMRVENHMATTDGGLPGARVRLRQLQLVVVATNLKERITTVEKKTRF